MRNTSRKFPLKGWFFPATVCVLASLCLGLCFASQRGTGVLPLAGPGTLFLRQEAGDFKAFREAFLAEGKNFKAHGFTAYSLHRDLFDPKALILVLQCSRLDRGIQFVRSPGYMSAIDRSGARIPTIWCGLDHNRRKFSGQSNGTAGIVIARNEVRDYPFWLKCFYAEDGGKHNHPGRRYKNSDYSIHHLPGDPAVAIVVHDASDVAKAPSFMQSDPLKNEMEATGVTGLEIWYGVNLEEGFF